MDQNTEKKNWLKRLQYDSWEPEILISGIVIYGLFKIFPYVDELHIYLQNYSSDFFARGTADENIFALVKVSISWLIFGFITHLFLRSFWVAYIGLSYVYKNEIDHKSLKYKKLFLKDIEKQKSITKNIENLESICSTIFSISILFFMNVLGLIFFAIVMALCVYLWLELFPDKTDFRIFDYILVTILITSVVDYLSSGLLKRIPYVNKVYYPFYKLVSYLTLAPFYRKIYYTFITNHKKWKVFLFLTLFIAITFVSTNLIKIGVSNGLDLSPTIYADKVMSPKFFLDEADDISDIFWLTSQNIDTQILEVFVVHTPAYEDEVIKPLCDYNQNIKKDSVNTNKIKLDCLNQFFELELDEKTVDAEFIYTRSYKTNQNGLKYYIPIDSLKRGRHSVSLYYNFYNDEKDTIYKRLKAKTDFYKETSIQ